mmetsp:Transcript_14410/g.31164  ORF Transcript_14410/g.31164 Transcript_14410/m.31164 type:complete len:231 (+) Transcript_14410:55-747(+)|eukprot:CAMPEP_0202890776 /NCGR_PEP_ID=MMETSP1392-20130828/1080_1 /ASSEMBLY_ACC=CAM_ASM_000868 /TAXON_ID=225041 /ORGANISM="Chlamydomonas chlamydogama, Strain SAG 11-48b" /LENGTH=230 /DNA_ID=CAMNT_0049574413 /DNA_START=14 /DNA_END=706 /DNA_ORIENTATION=+
MGTRAVDLNVVATHLGIDTSFARGGNGEPLPESEEEQTTSVAPAVSLVLGDDLDAGTGTLYITTSRVVWISSTQQHTFALTYRQIVMHAISRSNAAVGKACIYLQLDDGSEDMNDDYGENGSDADGHENGELPDVAAELLLVPEDESKVDDIFKALCDCAALNPDTEEEGEGEFFFDEAEVMAGLDDETRTALVAAQAAGMQLEEQGANDLEELVGDDPGRFEDDEGEEQ